MKPGNDDWTMYLIRVDEEVSLHKTRNWGGISWIRRMAVWHTIIEALTSRGNLRIMVF